MKRESAYSGEHKVGPTQRTPGALVLPPVNRTAGTNAAGNGNEKEHNMLWKNRAAVVVFAVLLAVPGAAWALINPKFTPKHLVQQADAFLLLKVKTIDPKGMVQTEVLRAVKGNVPPKALVLDLSTSAFADQAESLRSQLKQAAGPVVFVSTKRGKATLHVTVPRELGRWYVFERGKGDVWELEKMDTDLQAVWAGASDMLIRLADQIVKHPEMTVPVNSGCKWAEGNQRIGRVPGKVHGAAAVELAPGAPLALHVASESGDRTFLYDGQKKQFRDITDKIRLAAKSQAWAWGDFNADARVDLASWDGKQLALWLQSADGTFQAKTAPQTPAGDCLGLNLIGCTSWTRPGLLWSGPTGPVLLVPADDGTLAPKKAFDLAGADLAASGAPGQCLAADFDGDGLPDVLWPLAKGGLLFRGKEGGAFDKATACPVALGGQHGSAFLGDFDADGLLDVFAVSENPCRIWQNRGAGKFEETMAQSGEVEHVYNGKGTGGNTCDFNNDGRQDVFIAYSDREPHLFFNRGFRSFGHAHELDLAESGRLPESRQGVQAGLAADLDGDGAQDMALVLPNGDVWIVHRDRSDPPLNCRAVLPLGQGYPGPLNVAAWDDDVCLGAWNVVAGSSAALFAKSEEGVLTLKWRAPGKKEQSKTVEVLKSVRVELPASLPDQK
jgi:hypothetical protein